MKKRYSLLALGAALALVAGACGDSGDIGSPDDPFRIAVVAPSASNDLAFSQSIVDALNVIQADNGGADAVTIEVTDGTFVVEDAAAALRAYAADGVDFVIAHGSQYGGSLQEIAADFPDTAFAWGTAGDTFGLPNVFAYEAASDEGGYVLGTMAAAMTTTGTIGVVGPIETGDAALYVDGFVNGAEAGGATVNVNYIGSFSDVALAAEAAEAHVAAGADAMSGTAQMVVGAIGVADREGALWFGTQASQVELAPDIIVATQIYKWEVILQDMLDLIQDGTLGGQSFVIDLDNGGQIIEFNDAYDLPGDVRDLADDTIDGLKDGSISTGTG